MTNQDNEKSDGVGSRPNDQEVQESLPDHSATIKDIELNLLRELLKDGVGIGEGPNKALSQILREINDRTRRNFFTFAAAVSLTIGILCFIGYYSVKGLIESQLPGFTGQASDTAKAELASMQDMETRIARLENEAMGELASLREQGFETQGVHAVEDGERNRRAGGCTLHGTSSAGKIVFYPRGRPKAYEKGERVCVLSDTYPWACEKEALLKYVGTKVFLSIAEFEPGLYIDFTVIGFFSPRDKSRMIQITMSSLEDLVGTGNARKYIVKGVLDGEVIFPEPALEIGHSSGTSQMRGVRSRLRTLEELGL